MDSRNGQSNGERSDAPPPSYSAHDVSLASRPREKSRPMAEAPPHAHAAHLPDVFIGVRYRLESPRKSLAPQDKIEYIEFSPSDNHIVIVFQGRDLQSQPNPSERRSITLYHQAAGRARVYQRFSTLRIEDLEPRARGVAFSPLFVEETKQSGKLSSALGRPQPPVAAPNTYELLYVSLKKECITAVDTLGKKRRGRTTGGFAQAPMASSLDGQWLAAVPDKDRSGVCIISAHLEALHVKSCIPGHCADVSLIQWMPDRCALVSLSEDGCGRLVEVSPEGKGTFIQSFQIRVHNKPSILRISDSGDLVVSVWGRQVVLWYLESGEVVIHDLPSARPDRDLMPLAVSWNAKLLACRTETGLEIMDVATAACRGQIVWEQTGFSHAVVAAFHRKDDLLAVGQYDQEIIMYDVV